MSSPQCPVCGSASLVTVLSPIPGGGLAQVCQDCKGRSAREEREAVWGIARYAAKLLTYAGTLLIALTLAADRLSIAGRTGFGWRQVTGAEAGIVCLVLGLLSGQSLLGLGGLFLLVLSVGADLLQVGNTPGLGWRSQTALVIACVLVAAGMLWQLVLRRQRSVLEEPRRSETPPTVRHHRRGI